MARRRANTTKSKDKAEIKKKAPVKPLMQVEAQYFQELVETSNRYAALLKQKAQFEYIINKLNTDRKKIQSGQIKLPVTVTLIPNVMSYPEHDKKKALKFFDDQLTNYKNSLKALEGQITHRYEEYCESAIRTREYLANRFKSLKAKHIVPARKGIEDEENLFEAEFEKLMNDPETKAKFTEAKKEAIKKNTERATKKKGK
jgi:hypothetical protein